MGKYDLDFHAWAHEQADAARRRSANEIDWDNVAEELESLGKQQASELRNRYIILLAHLLKWRFQPERRGASWSGSIGEQRARIALHIEENPSLKPSNAEAFERAYIIARRRAAKEMKTSPSIFPEVAPFTPEQARDDDFWPEAE